MYVVVYQNAVILGPKAWNRYHFESVILEDTGLVVNLNPVADGAVWINQDLQILPVVDLPTPEFNPKIERLNGPFWYFHPDRAEQYFTVGDQLLEHAKIALKDQIMNARYEREIAGFQHTIQGNTVTLDTTRDGRKIFIETYSMMLDGETVNWKFPEMWINISKEELLGILVAGKTHIQDAFNWELSISEQIDSAETLEELDGIDLT